MTANILIINLAVLAVVLETDLGRRRITWFRIARPVLTAAAIVPFFLHGAATTGWGLALEVTGIGVGGALGLLAGALLTVHRDHATGRAHSRGGLPYALLWVVITAGRLSFSYGAEHLFPRALGRFLATHQVSADALGDAFIFFSLAILLTRTASLLARARTGPAAPACLDDQNDTGRVPARTSGENTPRRAGTTTT